MAILSPQGSLIAIYLEQMATVDGSESRLTTRDVQNPISNGIHYQAKLVQDF